MSITDNETVEKVRLMPKPANSGYQNTSAESRSSIVGHSRRPFFIPIFGSEFFDSLNVANQPRRFLASAGFALLCGGTLQSLSDAKCIHELLAESYSAFDCPFRTTSTKAFVWKPNHLPFCSVSERTDWKQLRKPLLK